MQITLVRIQPTILAAFPGRLSPFWAYFFLLLSMPALAAVPVILDTDMGNDIDDTLALAILHALESRGEAKIVAVTASKDNRDVAPAISAINTFYGRPGIPIGAVRQGKTPEDSPLLKALLRPEYPRQIDRGESAERAEVVLRRVMNEQPDGSIVLVQIGFSTNLARLLDNDAELVRRKVKTLVLMGGNFAGGEPEYNIKLDIPAAQKLMREWPTPIVASGYEVGAAILYPAFSIEHDFNYVPHHPVADAYRAYKPMPYSRPTWDLTAVLYAIRPDSGYFRISKPGQIQVDDAGHTRLIPAPNGRHRYLRVDKEQQLQVREAFRELASEPPQQLSH